MGFSKSKKHPIFQLVPKERVSCHEGTLLRHKRSGMTCYLVDKNEYHFQLN